MCESNENCECAEMTGRMWIEFGKMFNNMVSEGWEVCLEANNLGDFMTYSVYGYDMSEDDNCLQTNIDRPNPYLAMKDFYFHFFLEDMEEVNFDLNDETLKMVYELSDKEGITVDEMIVKILRLILPEKEKPIEIVEIEESTCCFNCIYFTDGGKGLIPYCDKMKIETEKNMTCEYFYPR